MPRATTHTPRNSGRLSRQHGRREQSIGAGLRAIDEFARALLLTNRIPRPIIAVGTCTLAIVKYMLRSVIAHVSLCAMLLHLAWGHCAHHLPACQSHCHEHAEQPAEAPAHDDCHESHASAVLSQATAAPSPSGVGMRFVPSDVAVACTPIPCLRTSAFCCNADPLRPLPLRAHLLLGVLLN